MSKHNHSTRRKTEQDYLDLASSRGFEFLGPYPKRTVIKTNWCCPNGHVFDTTFDKINQGRGCRFCARISPNNKSRVSHTKYAEYYHELAFQHGLKWLGPRPQISSDKTEWECPKGHRWYAVPHTINKGHSCPYCAGVAPHTPEDYQALAQSKNFIFLGPMPKGIHAKTKWRCPKGHIIEKSYVTMRNGCDYCAGLAPLTAGDYALLAEKAGLFWLGPMPANTNIPTNWQCQKGHVFERSWQGMKRVITCSVCGDRVNGYPVSRVQRRLHEMTGGELNLKDGRRRIDIALIVNDIKIAIEYDAWYWHGEYSDRDEQRNKQLINRGWHLLCVKSDNHD